MRIVLPSLLILILSAISLSQSVQAHPGRLDSKGGHYDRKTGQYHYHREVKEAYKEKALGKNKVIKETGSKSYKSKSPKKKKK